VPAKNDSEEFRELETWFDAKRRGRWPPVGRGDITSSNGQDGGGDAALHPTDAGGTRDVTPRDVAARRDVIIGRWSSLIKSGCCSSSFAQSSPTVRENERNLLYERYINKPNQWMDGLTDGGRVSLKELVERNKNKQCIYVTQTRGRRP